jgi:hypothetical protein
MLCPRCKEYNLKFETDPSKIDGVKLRCKNTKRNGCRFSEAVSHTVENFGFSLYQRSLRTWYFIHFYAFSNGLSAFECLRLLKTNGLKIGYDSVRAMYDEARTAVSSIILKMWELEGKLGGKIGNKAINLEMDESLATHCRKVYADDGTYTREKMSRTESQVWVFGICTRDKDPKTGLRKARFFEVADRTGDTLFEIID